MKESPEICIALHCAFQSGACVFDSQCFAALQVNSEPMHTIYLSKILFSTNHPPPLSFFIFCSWYRRTLHEKQNTFLRILDFEGNE